jgi:hypothetical protein
MIPRLTVSMMKTEINNYTAVAAAQKPERGREPSCKKGNEFCSRYYMYIKCK